MRRRFERCSQFDLNPVTFVTHIVLLNNTNDLRQESLIFLYLTITVVFPVLRILLLLHAPDLDVGRGFIIHAQM
jgi:hypothetical protein